MEELAPALAPSMTALFSTPSPAPPTKGILYMCGDTHSPHIPALSMCPEIAAPWPRLGWAESFWGALSCPACSGHSPVQLSLPPESICRSSQSWGLGRRKAQDTAGPQATDISMPLSHLGACSRCSQPGTRPGRRGWEAAPPRANEAAGKEIKY